MNYELENVVFASEERAKQSLFLAEISPSMDDRFYQRGASNLWRRSGYAPVGKLSRMPGTLFSDEAASRK